MLKWIKEILEDDMLKMAIVDDDAQYVEAIYAHIQRFQTENHMDIRVTAFSSGFELVADYKPVYDILLLDIEMPHLNGMEVAKAIRKSDPHAVIVFITNTAKYAINGYEVNAFDYMMKPIDYTQFAIKFAAAIDVIERKQEVRLCVPIEDGTRHIMAHEIYFIEIRDHWLHIFTVDGTFKMLGSLRDMEDKFAEHHFVKCNKSYLINLQHVMRIRSDSVLMQDNQELKMSRSKRKEVQTKFLAYYNRMRW